MGWGYYDYEDKNALKAAAEKQLTKRRKAGEPLTAILPTAKRDISTTFWGQAWNKNLMAYSDLESRMPRGRTYLRGGKVLDLKIESGKVSSTVHGSSLYDVSISITALEKTAWEQLRSDCAGQIGTLVELLSGKLSDGVMRRVTDLETGLFPKAKQIKINCSCPDYAGCCKHAAATLYAVSVRLDERPELLFTLRGVDAKEWIGVSSTDAVQALTGSASVAGDLGDADLSALFGIELGDVEVASNILSEVIAKPKTKPVKKASAGKKQTITKGKATAKKARK